MKQNKLIKASAGTGKTYSMSMEYLRLILSGVTNNEIMAITFTRKATAEIKERVINNIALLKAQAQGNITEESQNFTTSFHALFPEIKLNAGLLSKAEQELCISSDNINISTLDAFIQSIFSRLICPYMGINEWERIDKVENDELLRTLMIEIIHKPEFIPGLKKLYGLWREAKNFKVFQDLIAFFVHNRFELDWMFGTYRPLAVEVGAEDVVKAFDEIIFTLVQEQGSINYLVDFKEIIPLYQSLSLLKSKINWLAQHFKDLLAKDNFWNRKGLSKEFFEEQKQVFAEFKILLAKYIFKEEVLVFYDLMVELYSFFSQEYDDYKIKSGKLTFSDIAYYTYKYLYSAEDSFLDYSRLEVLNILYEYLANRFRFVLIDEFQDTSVLQWNILAPMMNEIIASDNGGVICVGDEKQAIYGWRGGEKRLLLDLDKILVNAEIRELTTNYRSSQAVMLFVNTFMGKVSQLVSRGKDAWPYSQINTHPSKPKGYVEINVYRLKQHTTYKNDYYRKLAQRIAQEAREGLVKIEDVAIIAKTNKELEELTVHLRKEQLPYALEGKISILDSMLVYPLLALLRFIIFNNKFDLLIFYRSKYCHLENEKLEKILLGEKGFEPDAPFYLEISQLIELSLNMSLDFLFRKMLEMFSSHLAESSEVQFKDLFRFLGLVSDFVLHNSSSEFIGFNGFFRMLDKYRDTEKFFRPAEQDDCSLKLMTIHKSKGLEFDTVHFVWDTKTNSSRDQFLLYKEYNNVFSQIVKGLALPNKYKGVLEYLPEYATLLQAQDRQDFYEDLNNLYVAITRAKNDLFLHVFVAQELDKIADCFDGEGKGVAAIYSVLNNGLRAFFEVAEINEGWKVLENNPVCWGERRHFELEPKLSLPQEKELFYDFWVEQVQKNIQDPSRFLGVTYLQNQLRGSFVHYYVSFIYRNSEQEHQQAYAQAVKKFGVYFSEEEISVSIQKVRALFSQEQALFSAEWTEIYNEYFIFYQDKEYRIDRLMLNRHKKLALIIDYKTGDISRPDQLEKYKEALHFLLKDDSFTIQTRYLEI